MGAHVVDYDSVGIPMIIKPPPPMPQGQARAYSASAIKQATRQSLVYTEKDINRVIAQSIRDGRPSSILLAADIALSSPIVAPPELRGLRIDGGGMFRIVAPREEDYTNCITLYCREFALCGVKLRLHPDTPAGASTQSVLDVAYELTDGLSSTIILDDVQLEYVNSAHFGAIVSSSGGYVSTRCVFRNVYSERTIGSATSVNLTTGDIGLRRSYIDTHGVFLGDIASNTTAQSVSFGNEFGAGVPSASTQAIDNGVTLYPCTPIIEVTISGTASGTFTISNTYDSSIPPGTIITIVCASKGAGTCSASDSGQFKLAGNWTPVNVGDSIVLMLMKVSGLYYWVELSRTFV
jgi:hypothetical protein